MNYKLAAATTALSLLLLLSASPTLAKSGGFSGGSVRSSSSFSSSARSSGFSSGSFKSTGSFSGGSSVKSPSGFTAPVRSTGAFFSNTPKAATLTAGPTKVAAPVLTGGTTQVIHNYSYNPFSGNFLIWYWMLGGFNHHDTPAPAPKAATTTVTSTVGTTSNLK